MTPSGRIWLEGDRLHYRSTHYGKWELAIADVRVIGEATNQDGPFRDDYFLCFATGVGPWWEASFYAEGFAECYEALDTRLGGLELLGLQGSVDFASRVLWPASLAGEPMFTYTDIPPKTWLGRLLGVTRNRQTYAPRVAALLAGVAEGGGA